MTPRTEEQRSYENYITKRLFRKNKDRAVEYLGGKCKICGYCRSRAGLAFHHRDPTQKEFNLTKVNRSWEKMKIELDKCDLLCHNCHSEIHEVWNRRESSEKSGKPIPGFEEFLILSSSHIPRELSKIFGVSKTIIIKRQRKIKAVSLKGGKCQKCGYSKLIESMEFHHRNPLEKDSSLTYIWRHSWDRVLKELEKCDLLCRNCHQETHEEEYNDKYEKEKERWKHIKAQTPRLIVKKSCSKCRKEFKTKSENQTHCSKKCSNSRDNRPTKIQWPSDSDLSLSILGKELGVSDNAIKKRCKTRNIPFPNNRRGYWAKKYAGKVNLQSWATIFKIKHLVINGN